MKVFKVTVNWFLTVTVVGSCLAGITSCRTTKGLDREDSTITGKNRYEVLENVRQPSAKDEEPEQVKEKKGWWIFKKKDKEEKPSDENNEPESLSLQDKRYDINSERGFTIPVPGAEMDQTRDISGVYRLKPLDAVNIILSGIPNGAQRIEDFLDENGYITLTYVGAVKAEGLTASELEKKVERLYTVDKKIFKTISVNVVIPAQSYFIRGPVNAPGRYPLVGGQLTLGQAIAAAGGFTVWANTRDLIIIRKGEIIEVDFREIEKDPTKDMEIRPGDTIKIRERVF